MKSILMATDLSARSDRALARAIGLARDHSADLTIVHVVDQDLPESLADAQSSAAKQAMMRHLETLAPDIRARISVEVVFGRAHTDVLAMSETTGAEIIVLGMHRDDTLSDMFLGTTVERTIRAGKIPVLLVKDQPSLPYRRIVIGVDFSVFARRAVEFAVKLVPDGEFHLVHAYSVPFSGFLSGTDTRREVSGQKEAQFQKMVDQEMAAFLAGLGEKAPRLERIMKEGTAREVIMQQVHRLESDLLVIGTHGRTGVANALLGSVAKDLLRAPPCDVLAVKAW